MKHTSDFTGYNPYLSDNAKQLRQKMTRHERKLWYDFLKEYPIRFNRQRVIENYIVDFYCSSAKIVIELDGGQHFSDEGIKYDSCRTKVIEKYGLKVLRIANCDIDDNFYGVCEYIDAQVKLRLNSAPLQGELAPQATEG